MPRYEVTANATVQVWIDVEADTADEAATLALEQSARFWESEAGTMEIEPASLSVESETGEDATP